MTKQLCGLLALLILGLTGCYSPGAMRGKADAGDPEAQTRVGMAYFYGAEPENRIDYDLALKYFQQAAEAREPVALYHLGEIYEKGLGSTAPDYRLARQYYAECAPGIRRTKGPFDGDSRFVNAKMFYFGRGEERDVRRAGSYFQRAAKCGSYEAMLFLAGFYAGEVKDGGITPDRAQAKELLEKAASKGYPAARYALALILEDSAPDQARKLMEQAALSDYPPAIVQVAVASGDPEKLHEAYLRAARMGYARAISELPVSEADAQKQLELLASAASRGDTESMLRLAESYERAGEPFKAIAAYYLLDVLSGKDPLADPALLRLDRNCGMVMPMLAAWDAYRTADALSLLNNRIEFFIEGYESGIAGVRVNLGIYFNDSAEDCLLGAEYLRLLEAKGEDSSRLAGDLFKFVPEEKRGFSYYFQYAIAAGLCGQGGIQLDAVDRAVKAADYPELAAKYPALSEDVKLLRANALVLLDRAPEAYEYLFANHRAGRADAVTQAMLNFVNQPWCAALRIDREKLAVSTGLERAGIVRGERLPTRPFFDLPFKCDSDQVPKMAEPELPEEELEIGGESVSAIPDQTEKAPEKSATGTGSGDAAGNTAPAEVPAEKSGTLDVVIADEDII